MKILTLPWFLFKFGLGILLFYVMAKVYIEQLVGMFKFCVALVQNFGAFAITVSTVLLSVIGASLIFKGIGFIYDLITTKRSVRNGKGKNDS